MHIKRLALTKRDRCELVVDAAIPATALSSVAVQALPSIRAQRIFILEASAIAAASAAISVS